MLYPCGPRRVLTWLACVLILGSSPAQAVGDDGFSVVHFDVSPMAERVFSVSGTTMPKHLEVYGGTWAHYGSQPLLLKTVLGGQQVQAAVIDELLVQQFAVGLGVVDRLAFELSFPLALLSAGDSSIFAGVGGVSAGDLSLTVRANLLGHTYDLFGLGATLQVHVPTGSADALIGDGTVRISPRINASFRGGPVIVMANVGATIRSGTGTFRSLELTHELVWGLGANFDLHPVVDLGVELIGRSALSGSIGEPGHSPVEVVVGPKVTPWKQLQIEVAGGLALNPGYGAPQWRIVAGVSWRPASPALPDSDGDGLTDNVDRCPDVPEDPDGFADDDGCPEDDNDNDGVSDAQDRCRDREGRGGDLGCSKGLDHDGDGLVDAVDRCPDNAASAQGRHGCPPGLDRDGDGHPDLRDACPLHAEPKLPHGCPLDVDLDGDGKPDFADRCPYVAGVNPTGCPGALDTDSDGLPDTADHCPTMAGDARTGCPPGLDSDSDGLLDVDDRCPDLAHADGGCPTGYDSDGDGVEDLLDRCPRHAQGPNGFRGCPATLDSDGDGLFDAFDRCPHHRGGDAPMGCPSNLDTDKDGLIDEFDRCPLRAQTDAGRNGCPPTLDSDGDGILDMDDRCPQDASPDRAMFGCPPTVDSDRDGIADAKDKCPSEPEDGEGTAPTDGCPAGKDLEVKDCKIDFSDSVFFASGTATLKANSRKLLEDVAKVLIRSKAEGLVVEGHTDTSGGRRANRLLSERRAEAVIARLRQLKLLTKVRLQAQGFGSARPLASNKTAKGRAKNRRVEFRIIGGKCLATPSDNTPQKAPSP